MNQATQRLLDLTKSLASGRVRRRLKLRYVEGRRHLLSSKRPLPEFLIIGAQRAGTTSLYRYLDHHPGTRAAIRKEVAYFTLYHTEPVDWYRAHFPVRYRAGANPWQAFEATPDYLFVPGVAPRVAALLPAARVVVLLRDPAERAFSHHQHMSRLGFESLPFEEALRREEARTAEAYQNVVAGRPLDVNRDMLRFSYAGRGRYARQLADWLAHVPAEHLIVEFSENLYQDTVPTLLRIADFLRLPGPHRFGDTSRNHSYDRQARSASSDVPPEGAAMLRDELRDDVRELAGLLDSLPHVGPVPDWLRRSVEPIRR